MKRPSETLLTSKMAVLLDEAEVARYGGDRLLLNGLFCVKHKLDFDRLIIDRRPANAGEAPWIGRHYLTVHSWDGFNSPGATCSEDRGMT